MSVRTGKLHACALKIAGTAAALLLLFSPVQAQRAADASTNIFGNMSGSWSGTGSITFASGEKERIRCRVSYSVNDAGNRVEQELRCASDSYKFELLSEIEYANGYITGRWDEKTNRTSGTISGRASVGQIEALAETSAFSAFFTLITRGDRQSVKIESQSPDIREVAVSLRRTGK